MNTKLIKTLIQKNKGYEKFRQKFRNSRIKIKS